jgi:Domain of unknown function (DUF4192)
MEQTLTINDQLVELGSLVNNEETAVQRVGANLIDGFFMSFTESDVDMETTALVLHYLTDIQVRDFALGILDKYKNTEEALKYLVDKAPTDTEYINAPASLLAQFYYEQGNTADAFLMLSIAQENYSLARLLDRVFKAGWNPEGFARMREELHPQVVAGIFGEDA